MNYYINLFSPYTFEMFSKSDRTVSGFRIRQKSRANKLKPGDKFICYMTKLSRWIGVFEILGNYFIDEKPIFSDENDIFIVRFKINPICWLPVENSIPIHDELVWNKL